jgi:DNA repair exonuclease SbcCD ATPase subunit
MSIISEQIERAEAARAEVERMDALRAQAAQLETLKAEAARQARAGQIMAEVEAMRPAIEAEIAALRAEAQSIREEKARLNAQAEALAAKLVPYRDRVRALEYRLGGGVVSEMQARYPREELQGVEIAFSQLWQHAVVAGALNTITEQNMSAREMNTGLVLLKLARINSMPRYR